jgi:ankyrin repeat protein
VCVEFDGGKGQINYVASSQIQKVAEKSAADKAAAEKAAAEKAAAEKAATEKAAAEKRNRDLFEAAKAGNNDELKRLIDLGGDVLWKNPNDSGMTALHYAAFGGHLACVETLLLAKVRLVDNLTPDEATALHSAACGGHVNCIEALLRAKVRLDATTTDGDTALHIAASIAACSSKSDAVKRLLAAGASTAIRNKAGQTALDVLAPVLWSLGLMSLDPRQRISAQACIDAHPYLEHDLF